MKEIVGAQIEYTVTNMPRLIAEAVSNNRRIRFLSRAEMQFMASCDLGKQWEDMASGPTLFFLDDNGNPVSVEPVSDVRR